MTGPAKCESVVVALERRFLGGIEEVPGIQLFVTEKVVCSAVKEVGARFQGEIHHAARRSARIRAEYALVCTLNSWIASTDGLMTSA